MRAKFLLVGLSATALAMSACGSSDKASSAAATTSTTTTTPTQGVLEDFPVQSALTDAVSAAAALVLTSRDFSLLEVSAGGRGLTLSDGVTDPVTVGDLTFTDGETDSSGPKNISVNVAGSGPEDGFVVMAAVSDKTHTCFYVRGNGSNAGFTSQKGAVEFASDEDSDHCNATSVPTAESGPQDLGSLDATDAHSWYISCLFGPPPCWMRSQ